MSKLWHKLNIKNKIIIVILTSILVVTLPICSFTIYSTYDKEITLFNSQLDVLAKLTSKNLIAPINFEDREGVIEIIENVNDNHFINFIVVLIGDEINVDKSNLIVVKNTNIKEIKKVNLENLINSNKFTNIELKEFLVNYGSVVKTSKIKLDKTNLGYVYIVGNINFITKDIINYTIIVIFIEFLILIFAYFFALKIQNVISRPIIYLAEQMNLIANKNQFTQIELIKSNLLKNDKDEISQLYNQFNFLIEQIKENQLKREEIANELYRLNLELENKVKERTEDLLITNNELKEEIEKRNIIEKELENLHNTKDRLLKILAHDLKNPLLALKYRFEKNTYQLTQKLYREVTESSQDIENNITYLINMVDELLLWSNSYSNNLEFNPQNIHLKSLIYSINEFLYNSARNKSIMIEVDISEDIYVYADKFMVSTAIRNLISNSIKFTRHLGWIKINAIRTEDFIEISIIDNGIGMNEDEVKNIFNLDFKKSKKGTDDESGTGLGMIISQDLINKNSGSLWVDSFLGKGTTFTILLVEGHKD